MKKHILWLLALLWSVTAVGETITVARALEICGGLASGVSTTESYTIEGYVNNIASNDFNSTYNNMRFWIADTKGSASTNANGALLVYRGRPDVELQVGDKVSVTSTLINYKGTTYETNTNNCPVTLLYRPTVLTERDTTFGSLRICAQNLENYYINSNTGRGNFTQAEINAKTSKIVNMMLTINADIYAFCEVEAKPEVLTYLANAANSTYGANVFVAVSDGIDVDWDATLNNNIKSGFIYRSDRVAPVGSNNAIYSANYYCNTMRYQAFQQLSNGEKLVVSMNHFKAKDSSSDQGESTRLTNANRLVNTLSTVTTDPDILILGDLNCQYGEAPITYIMNAGYAEQILRFDSTNYSHCYGGGELIDHVIANSSMEQQIVDAYVRHLSTTCSTGVTSDMSYSDHDPYVVEINLSSSTTPSSITTCAAAAQAALSVSANNELYNNGATYTIRGYVTAIQTAYNSSYGNITFWMADTQNGGKVLEAYRCSADASAVPNVGDYVEVTGNLTKYGSTPEFASGCSCQVIYTSAPPVNLGTKTIYEFLQLKNVKDTCVLTGIVENIVMDSEDTTQYNKFGNFYINDGTGSLYIYGLLTADGQTQQFRTMGIDEGDTLTLKAFYAEYNSNPQAANAIYVSHSKFVSTNWGPVTVKLDPSSTTMYSWNQVGIWAWVTNGTKSTDLFEQWPGVPVTIDPETGWWSYTFNSIPSGQLNIIWNDFGSYGYQTDDIENVTENTCYRLPSYSYLHEVVDCPTTHDTIFLYSVANYIDFQALYDANPSIADTTVTSYQYVTLPNGSQVCGFMKTDGTEANNTWNVKTGYNTLRPTPEWDGVEAFVSGTEFRAASGSSIRLGAFTMENAGKLTVYFSPNGDSERGVSIAVKGDTVTYRKSGVKIDGVRPAYAVDVNLPAGYYAKGDIVITVVTNTTNILGVGIHPDPIIGERVIDLTVAEAVALSDQQPVNVASSYDVSVVGYVVSTQNYEQTYGTQSFLIADDMSGTVTMKAYLATPEKNGVPYPVLTGDKVRITGPIEHYVNNNTGEDFAELLRPSVTFINEAAGDRSLPAIPELSVADALQYGYSMEVGYRTGTTYDIVGYVTNIEEDAMDTYGNMTFWIADETNGASSNAEGGLYIFRGIPDRRLQTGDIVRVRSYIRHTAVTDSSSIVQTASGAGVMYIGHPAANVPTTQDLKTAGYNIINNIVLCFYFGYAPCNDVVIAGNYNGWTTETSECVRMSPLAGFDGWYAAQIPYNTNGGTWDNQAKPVQLANDGSFNWEYQAGDVNAWIHRGGNETEFEMFAYECTPYLSNPGAYIYEISYWKNHNNPCNEIKSNYAVYLSAPQNAPDSIEIIGSFDNWAGTPMTYDAQFGYWMATINASSSDYFMFREAGTWDNQILVYDSAIDDWTELTNCMIGDYIISDAIVYADFSNPNTYRWTTSGSGSDTSAVTDPIELTIASITSNFYTEDNDIWYHLYLEDEENYFAIDIIVPQGMGDVELGHVYTWSDMLQQYCQGHYNSQNISYSDVQFVKIQTANGVQISALITATNGQQYILTYVGADATPFDYDAETAYSENFSDYSSAVNGTNKILVSATQDDDATLQIEFNVPEGCDTLAAGTYTINATGNPMTVKASEGFVSGITTSWAGYYDGNGYIDIPVWYLVSGTVTVAADGTINVNALNSKGYAVQCQLAKAQVTTYQVYLSAPANAPESVEIIGSFSGWSTGVPMIYDADLNMWHATIQAVATDEFKFRQVGTWSNQIQVYDAENDMWLDGSNLIISEHLSGSNIIYVDYSNSSLYRWTVQPGNWFIDWNNLPAGYVFEAVCPQDASYQALKSVKVYADTTYIHMLIEPDLNELPDLSWIPLDIYLNTDNSNNTGGNNTIFIDAYADVLLEGGVFVDGEFAAYDPYGYKWWGAAGEIDWNYWVDPNTNHDDSDCWGALVCEGQWNGAISSQYINGKIEMKLLRSAIPATWNKTQFGIGFNLMSTSWETYGVLPIGSPTDENPNGLTNMMTVRMYGAPDIPSEVPTASDLWMAGYDIVNNVVLAYKFDVAPCYDVVIAGTYMMDSAGNWITDPSQLVHMMPLAGFNGWYAAQIPYTEYSVQAKPVQLSDIGAFNWDNQAGDFNAWIHRGGTEAYIVSGYDNEVNVSYESPGAYIYEIAYWKNNNNPCTSQTTTYTVFLEAPQNAPDSIEIIGSFDNWMGTLMTYDAQTGYWTATITGTPSDVFKFRQAGNWDNEILVYNSAYDDWTTLPNLVISQYLYDNIIYLDFDNAELYRWTKQDDESVYYIPYNLQAVSEPGKVVFTWDAEMISDSYALHIYDVNDNDRYLGYLSVQGVTTLTYMVEDFLDGKEIRWSVEPISPYDLDEVFADSTIVMHKSEVELSGFNLTTVDSITLDLTWQSNKENLLYRVEVDYNGSIIREETVNLKEYHFTSKLPGWHQVYVLPLNADGEAVGRYTYAGEINLARVPEPFSNLQGAANEHELTFTWNKVVDSVYVQIFRMVDGEFSDYIYHAPTAGNSMVYTVNEDGNYALQLRAYLEIRPGQYGTVDYAKYITVQAFSVPTYSIQIDAAEGGYIWPDLSGEYPLGYTLKAYAYPYEGYRFVGWSDGVTEAERTIHVQGAMSITAQFEALAVYTVAVQASEGGWIYVSGDMSSYDVSYTGQWYEDSQMTIYASAAEGYSFYQWSDGVTDAQRTVTVNSNINLTAIFMPNRHLTLAVNDIAMGGISVAGDYDYADGVYTTVHGASLTLTAQPNQGYRFVSWSDGVQTVQRVVTMTDDIALTAIFELIITPVVQYSITVSAGTGGTVNDASGIYNAGDHIELTATPMEGYEFVQWSDGVSTNPRTLIVTENKSLTAIFRIRTISISVTAGPGGTVNGTVSGFYNYGTSVSFSAVPAEHYRFTGWSDGNTDIDRSITLVKDTVITASFVAIPLYTLNLTAGQGGQIRVNNEPYTTTFNRAYEENTSVVIEAAANANYIFSRWSDGNTNAIRVEPMNSDLSLTAEFLPIYTLTIIANNGSVLVQGDAEATANNVYKAVAGTVLTLTAQPAEGYRFVSWSDGVQTISRDITLTSTTFLVATFEVAASTPQYTVTVGITGTGTGTVNGQTSISTLYYENDQVPLTAIAGESSEFVGWSDGVTTASRTLVVSSDTLVIAIFNFVEPTVQYTVTFKNYDGTILESKKWNEGETPTCSVTPTHPDDEANTYSFIGWTPEIVPVTADAVYTAVFEATPVVLPSFTVTFYDWDDTVISQQSVPKGENATPPQTPTRAGYVFTGWDGNYTNVQHDEAVFATYKPAEEALEDVLDGNNAVKIFREGQIFILRGDKTYTLDGQIVR